MLRKSSDNWPYLKTTNPIEPTFTTVCLRSARTKGADVNAVDVQPQTPLDEAIQRKHPEQPTFSANTEPRQVKN
jgi:hypothetical protein